MSHRSFDREGTRGNASRLKYLYCTLGTSRVSLVPPGDLGVSGVWSCEPETYEAMCTGSWGQVQLGLGVGSEIVWISEFTDHQRREHHPTVASGMSRSTSMVGFETKNPPAFINLVKRKDGSHCPSAILTSSSLNSPCSKCEG
jgi:hypothetical protein